MSKTLPSRHITPRCDRSSRSACEARRSGATRRVPTSRSTISRSSRTVKCRFRPREGGVTVALGGSSLQQRTAVLGRPPDPRCRVGGAVLPRQDDCDDVPPVGGVARARTTCRRATKTFSTPTKHQPTMSAVPQARYPWSRKSSPARTPSTVAMSASASRSWAMRTRYVPCGSRGPPPRWCTTATVRSSSSTRAGAADIRPVGGVSQDHFEADEVPLATGSGSLVTIRSGYGTCGVDRCGVRPSRASLARPMSGSTRGTPPRCSHERPL
jgi:hypothetical protein